MEPAVVAMRSELLVTRVAPDCTVIGPAPSVRVPVRLTDPSSMTSPPAVALPLTVNAPVALVPAEKMAVSPLALLQGRSVPVAPPVGSEFHTLGVVHAPAASVLADDPSAVPLMSQ